MADLENTSFNLLSSFKHIIFIRKQVIEYCEEIVTNSSTKINQQTLVEQKIQSIIAEINGESNFDSEELLLLKTTLNQLFLAQIPLSKLAASIRELKNNSPKIFR